MSLTFYVVLLCAIELLLWLPPSDGRRLAAIIVASLVLPVQLLWLASQSSVLAVIVSLFGIYRVINLVRFIKAQRQASYLLASSRQSSQWLCGLSLVGTIGAQLLGSWQIAFYRPLAVASVLMASTLFLVTQRQLAKTRPHKIVETYSDRDLPTVTVAIPARNETDDLNACLASLLTSTYPKLEILVLDDCSQNPHTPAILRGFAHDGVRFVAGQIPPANWLAKNYAYQQLLEASSGDLLLFCGVDVRFKPESLHQIVAALVQKQKSMISLIPANIAPRRMAFTSLLVQPSRYAWELMLPRRHWQRPPVLSSAWLIKRTTVVAAGGFGAVRRTIIPERYFAGFAADHGDGYSFIQSDTSSGISNNKQPSEQLQTAIRNRYPQLHQRIELVALSSLGEGMVLVGPFLLVLHSLIYGDIIVSALAGAAVLLLTAAYFQIVRLTYRQFLLRGLWFLPVAALFDIALLHYSMLRYEFSQVAWKGRNVCLPVMRVIPKLPSLPR